MSYADGTTEITNSEDIIDSREIIARIEYLTEAKVSYDDGIDMWSDKDETELTALTTLAEAASGYAPEWDYGELLIRDSYFEAYAQELANECGMVPDALSWPLSYIDWEAAATALQDDYTEVDFSGVSYWIR
jgi:hypothetical protein